MGGCGMNASVFLSFSHLQYLDLSSNFITGWTHHLSQLTTLDYLDLSVNIFHGMIDVYGALENLQVLYLDGNGIDGFKRSHGNLSSTSKLETLSLIGVVFSDANIFLDSLSLLPSVKSIYLKNTDLGSIETYGWLCQLKNIQNLIISGNGLQGQFPLCLKNLTYLRTLDLSLNNLHGELPLFLANLTTIQSLDLSSNQFVRNVANSPLTKLTSLRELTLSNNNFQIPRTLRPFANLSTLEKLWLDGNDFIPDNETQHPIALKFQLSSLSMSNCKVVRLPHFILSQVILTYLDLSHNSIEGSFPTWLLENNKPLVFLNLANNSLTGPIDLLSQYKLIVLDVSNNHINYLSTNLSKFIPEVMFLNLSRNSIKVIAPSNFGDLKNLSCLDLSYNHVNSEMSKDCFKGCVSLEALFLSHNKLENIPSLLDSTSLKILRLNNNNLSGMIPANLFPSSLRLLDMSNNNNLGGQIPAKFCKFNSLNFLDLSYNRLLGSLPPCFDGSNLVCVFLSNNKLNGSVLSIFKNNTSLKILDVGNNHLSGVIPKSIGDLRRLSSVILRNNHFEGEIPDEVCSLDHLAILDLSNNNISGQIPHCLSRLTFLPQEGESSLEQDPESFQNLLSAIQSLTRKNIFHFWLMVAYLTIQNELDISTKSHTYTYVGKDLDGMSAVDLSCNNLSGEIPLEIGSMFGVHGVNLSHNKLDGLIPSTLSNLSNIESLDLSYNHLYGSIPFELMRLHYLGVLNVAYNNLSGRIPEDAQFGTFDESSYKGNLYLCGPPILKDCYTDASSIPKDQVVEDVDRSFDMCVFYICFAVSSAIMFVGTLVVLYVNPYWRRVWFYFAEMWITYAYYFIIDSTRKAIRKVMISS